MSNLAHANDCLNYMYLRSGDSVSNPQFAANALTYMNIAYREMVSGTSKLIPQVVATFPWAKAAQPKTLTLIPVETGTATIVQNSTGITFSSGPASTRVGYHIKFGTGANAEVTYRIITHTAGDTAATLDSEVVSSSASVTYTMFKIDWTVGSSDILRMVDVFNSYIDPGLGSDSYQLIGEPEREFRRYFPTFTSGTPTHFTILYESAGTFTVRFNKYAAALTYKRLEIPYIPIPTDLTASDLSIPIVPLHHRQTLCDLALFLLFQDTNDNKAQMAFEAASSGYVTMLKEIGMKDLTMKPFRPNEEAKLS